MASIEMEWMMAEQANTHTSSHYLPITVINITVININTLA